MTSASFRFEERDHASAGGAVVAIATRDATTDPSARLVAAFRAAAERVHGLGFVNPALDVEAVGFAPWDEHWLGVMVTPWAMNLLIVPRHSQAWTPLALGAKRSHRFPAGDYEFVGADDAIAGPYQVCSLFSPMFEFGDQGSARLVATLARAALLDPANAEEPEPRPNEALRSAAIETTAPGPLAQLRESLDAPLSKRDFLRARFLGTDRDDRR
jgi:[NiFe] hydrogenase assembly HybE family chaperone